MGICGPSFILNRRNGSLENQVVDMNRTLSFVCPTQILRAAGKRPFLGGNLGTPLSVAALECLAFPPDDPPYQVSVRSQAAWQQGTNVG